MKSPSRILIILPLLLMPVLSLGQTVWFTDQFKRTEPSPDWKAATGIWRIDNGHLKINTTEYDQLLASTYYVYGSSPFSVEVTLRGIRAGVFFNLETMGSKSLSHMVRFDEKSILTGYMNAAGEYTATNVFDVETLPTEWTILRIDVDPKQKRYEIFLNGKSIGVDEHLMFTSGHIGLEASDGVSEFKSVSIVGKGKNIAPAKPQKGSAIDLRHVAYVQAVGQDLVIHSPERGRMQRLDPAGRFLEEFSAKIMPVSQRETAAGELKYVIDGKRILVKNEQDAIVDSITERLVMPACLLTDYALVRGQSPSLFVADPGAHAIHRFGLSGNYLGSFTGSSIGGLIAPRCIDFYGKDEIVIADYSRIVFVKKNLRDLTPEVRELRPTGAIIMWPRTNPEKPSLQLSVDGKRWSDKGGSIKIGRNTVILDNLKPLTRYSYTITPTLKVIPPGAVTSGEFRFSTPPSDSSMMAYTRLRVLCMVYRTISYRDVYPKSVFPQVPDGRTITEEELDYLRDACSFNAEFYFRNSSCRVGLEFDFYVVQDTLWLHELGDKDPYWLSCNDRVTRDYEKAVLHFGKKPEEYNGLICPYAWVNYPPRRKSALSDTTKTGSINIRQAYGGGTNGVPAPWKYGKTTGYTGNPFQDKFSRQDWLITHEFHHQIDALMEASGYPGYYHADQPWKMPGRFGEDFDFNAHIIRNAGPDWWLNLKFGTLVQTRDADRDGVPDDDPKLPFDEKRSGGNQTRKDTDGDGLNDLQEVVAGTSRGSRLDVKDTDLDGITDGLDPEPLYSMIPASRKMGAGNELMVVRGGMFGNNGNVYASVSHGWDDSTLSFIFHLPDTANVLVQIDANNDGWFHGFDNFQIRVGCAGDSIMVIDYYLRDCSSWVNPPTDRKDILSQHSLRIDRTSLKDGYCTLAVSIPRNDTYGLSLHPGKKIGIRVGVQTKEDRWVWDELFERNYMMTVELK